MEVSLDVRQSDENPQFPLFLENKHFFLYIRQCLLRADIFHKENTASVLYGQ